MPQGVAGGEGALGQPVADDEGGHAMQLGQHGFAFGGKKGKDDLGVRRGAEYPLASAGLLVIGRARPLALAVSVIAARPPDPRVART